MLREKHRTGVEGGYGGILWGERVGRTEHHAIPVLWNILKRDETLNSKIDNCLSGWEPGSTWTNRCLALPNQGSLLLAKVRSAMMSWGVRFKYVQIIQIVSRPFYTFLNSSYGPACAACFVACCLLGVALLDHLANFSESLWHFFANIAVLFSGLADWQSHWDCKN